MSAHRFLFAMANTPWVYALAESLALEQCPAAAITLHDWLNYRRLRPAWPNADRPGHLAREMWVYPPGYMGALEPAFRPILRRRWRRVLRQLAGENGPQPWVICPYPWLVDSFRGLAPGRMIYFNLDDYELYRTERAAAVRRQEDELVARSELVFCLAQTQVDAFRRRYPARAERIRHLPLAAPDAFINPEPERGFGGNSVGYVGNLIDRVDWDLAEAVALQLPEVEFVFVGYSNITGGGGQRPNWRQARDRVLALPNVRHVESVPQGEVAKYYWSFAVSWIPYATDHLFNRASCPTKIMDGLASGRPVISSDVPECRLYGDWISIFRTPVQAVGLIRAALARVHDSDSLQKSERQVAFVQRSHTWQKRAVLVQQWLAETDQAVAPTAAQVGTSRATASG